jgi:hypothetical protein
VALSVTAQRIRKKEKPMRTQLVIWLVLLVTPPLSAQSQVMLADPQFAELHPMRWNMTIGEARDCYETLGKITSLSDSTITLKTEYFGVPASTVIRFRGEKSTPTLIHVKFTEPSNSLVEALTSHFKKMLQTDPAKTSTEKNFLGIRLRIETAAWKTTHESVVVTFAQRDGLTGEVGVIITRLGN